LTVPLSEKTEENPELLQSYLPHQPLRSFGALGVVCGKPRHIRGLSQEMLPRRALARYFFVSAASAHLGVSGRRIYFHRGRKVRMAETGLHWQRRFWSAP